MTEDLAIDVDATTRVSALARHADDAHAALVLAHGAGAGMRHAFLEALSEGLAMRGVSTLRFQFPSMERGAARVDAPPVAHATVRAAVARARTLWPDLPLFAGGKSFGGRMTSQADAVSALDVRGIVFVGFPLHPAKKPSTARAEHLAGVHAPLLFLQGTRDELADLALVRQVVETLGTNATLVVFGDADHSFHVRKSSGSTDARTFDALVDATVAWMRM